MLYYRESLAEKSKLLAEKVLEETVRRGVRPNPINFMVQTVIFWSFFFASV